MNNIIQLQPIPDPDTSLKSIHAKLNHLERIIVQLTQTLNYQKLKIETSSAIHFLDPELIDRCEASGNYTKVYLNEGGHLLLSKTLKSIQNQLPAKHFIRCHQSHLVNIHRVRQIDKSDGLRLLLDSGALIPISRNERSSVIKTLYNS